jgi:hypothetical protein
MRATMRLCLLLAGAVLATASASAAVVITSFTATPTSGISPVDVVLNWSTTGAASCAGTGGWTGAKATGGTQTLLAQKASASYTLTCTATGGQADLSWTAPTLNTDGTALTNLAGYRTYFGTDPLALQPVSAALIPAGTLTQSITGLAAGTWYFGVRAETTAAIQSNMAGPVSKIVTVPSAAATVAVTINTQPLPPVLTVAVVAGMLQTPVYSVAATGKMSTFVGFADVGTQCTGAVLFTYRNKAFREVPRAAVKLWGSTTLRLAAPCA